MPNLKENENKLSTKLKRIWLNTYILFGFKFWWKCCPSFIKFDLSFFLKKIQFWICGKIILPYLIILQMSIFFHIN